MGRNDIAHFAERLDSWYMSSERHNISMHCIGPRGEFSGTEPFKQLIVDEMVYYIAGSEVKLQELVTECERIAAKSKLALKMMAP